MSIGGDFLRIFSFIYRLQALRLARLGFKHSKASRIHLFGYTFNVDTQRSDMHKLLALQGERFIEEKVLFQNEISQGNTVIDVGANIGYYSLLFRKLVGSTGKILAIEPEPTNYKELQSTISENKLENVTTIQKAVGGQSAVVDIAAGVNGRISDHNSASIQVPMITLDDIAPTNTDFIKIDVEGYEGEVLSGMKNILLKDKKPKLFIEVHPWCLSKGATVSSIIEAIRKAYRERRYFEKTETKSLLSRILVMYKLKSSFQELSESDAEEREGTNSVFWVLAK